jgi:hypothetical protein
VRARSISRGCRCARATRPRAACAFDIESEREDAPALCHDDRARPAGAVGDATHPLGPTRTRVRVAQQREPSIRAVQTRREIASHRELAALPPTRRYKPPPPRRCASSLAALPVAATVITGSGKRRSDRFPASLIAVAEDTGGGIPPVHQLDACGTDHDTRSGAGGSAECRVLPELRTVRRGELMPRCHGTPDSVQGSGI